MRQRLLCLIDQPGIFDRDHGLLGEILEQRNLPVREGTDLLAKDRERADQFSFLQHRDNEDGAGTCHLDHFDRVRSAGKVAGSRLGIVDMDEPMGLQDFEKKTLRMRLNRLVATHGGKRRGDVMTRRGPEMDAIPQVQNAESRFTDARGIFQHLAEHRRQLTRRRTDCLQHLRCCGLLLERLGQITGAGLNLIEQPGIFDRDDRLVCECLGQRDLLFGERPLLPALQGEDAYDFSFAQQWHTKSGAYVDDFQVILAPIPVEVAISQEVRNMNRTTFENRPAEDGPPIRFHRIAREIITFIFREANGCGDRIDVTLAPTDNPGIRFAQPCRRTHQCLQDSRQIKRRLADDFENFSGRCLLLQRFVPLPGDPCEGCSFGGGCRASPLRRVGGPRPGRFGSCLRATWHCAPSSLRP